MKKYNCYCTVIVENGLRFKDTREVIITVDASGLSEARLTAKGKLKQNYHKLFGVAFRKIERCYV